MCRNAVDDDRCSSDKLVCTTSAYQPDDTATAAAAADDDDQGLICLTIDGVKLDLNHTLFTYADDPVITHMQPATSFTTLVQFITKSHGMRVNILQYSW